MVQKLKLLLAEGFHKLNYISNTSSNSLDNKIINGLKRDGYYTIESFLTNKECEVLKEKTDDFIKKNEDKISFESNGSDKRVYGIDKYDNTFVIEKIEAISNRIYSKFSFIYKKHFFYLLGKIESSNKNLGSGSGWHRDSPITNQFKTILYLSNVNDSNGPFEYIKGSHTYDKMLKVNQHLNKALNKRRFSDEEIELLVKDNVVLKPERFLAPQGTLIFVNTRGIHRGAPLKEEKRYALTRYHFPWKNKKFN